jgi:hypothetical protein
MKNYGIIICLFGLLFSCDTETDRRLSTDLQVEGTEIFNISMAIEESFYYGLLTFDDYRNALRDSIALPGCPTIAVDLDLSQVHLSFESNPACSSQQLVRTGSLYITFVRNTASESLRVMRYADYKIKSLELTGERTFSVTRGGTPNTVQESFERVRIMNSKGSSARISGNFAHQLQLINRQVVGYTSVGQLTGTNIAGRRLTMEQTTPRQYLVDCIQQGAILARQGAERWSVARGQRNTVQSTLVYETVEGCQSKANVSLPDGRVLVFSL